MSSMDRVENCKILIINSQLDVDYFNKEYGCNWSLSFRRMSDSYPNGVALLYEGDRIDSYCSIEWFERHGYIKPDGSNLVYSKSGKILKGLNRSF